MDHSVTFARHFSRLFYLLLHDADNVVEQKMSLRALTTVNKRGVVTLIARAGRLFADTDTVADALHGVRDLADHMAEHSVIGIRIAADARPADLLGLARALASQGKPGDGGVNLREQIARLKVEHVDLAVLPPQTPAATPPAKPANAEPAARENVAASEAPTVVASDAPTKLVAPREDDPARVAAEEAARLLAQLAAPDGSKLSHEDLFRVLDTSPTTEVRSKAIEDLVLVAEHSQRVGKFVAVGEVFHGLVSRERAAAEGEGRRRLSQAIKRLSRPAVLRAIASLIPKRPEQRQFYYEVLDRAGEDGADATVEQLNQAPTHEDRKALFEVLRELKEVVPALTRMLGDSRWFVVRNAAELLGEMGATQAEDALVGLLQHSDDRVRRSATSALLTLGTPDAMKGIYEAVSDRAPEVRIQATAAISTKRDAKTSHTLIRAIEDETDTDVQLAMIAALGRIATADAVQKLVKMAEPEGRLFRKKTTTFRVAAVQALGDAKTPAALAALRELSEDKDREVRDTAKRALAHSTR